VRKKRQKNDLFTESGEQLAPSALEPYIGGLTQSIFQNQFCLSRESLIAGSSEIAKGKGDVGESLYNAALGNTNLSKIIGRLEKPRDELFKETAQKPLLNAAISAFNEQKKLASTLITRPDAWQRLIAQRDQLVDEIDKIKAGLQVAAATAGLLTALKACYPNYDRLRSARAALHAASGETWMSTEAVERATELLDQLKAAEKAIAVCQQRMSELLERIGPEHSDPLIDQHATIDALVNRSVTYRKGCDDLQRLDLHGHAIRNALAAQQALDAVWPGVDLEEARKRNVSADLQERGNALVPELVRVTELCRLAGGTEQRYKDELSDVEGALGALPPLSDQSVLRAAFESA
jgi:uncharacterized protein YhaN